MTDASVSNRTDAGSPSAGRTSAPSGASGSGATDRIRRMWDTLAARPGGRRLFSWLVGRTAPYTGTIGARVEELREGYARLTMRDRRRVRNHLRSVHAVAQFNLAEEASGLAIVYSMPAGLRGIPVHLAIDYEKKARGTITAVCELEHPIPTPAGDERVSYEAPIVLTDSAGDVVSRVRVRWVIGR